MSNPESNFLSQTVRELRRAEGFGREGRWADADGCYASAVAIDLSPTSRIAFGNSLATRERFNEAICQLTAALDVATQAGDREALGVIFHNLAAIYRELGDADLARRFQQRALQQYEACGPSELLGLANDAWMSRRTELAACLSASCADMKDDSDDCEWEAQATLSVITGLSDDPREAIRSLIHVYKQHRALGAERLMGIDLLNLAVLFSMVAWYRSEIQLVERAIRHFEQAPAPVSAARARQVLDTLRRMQSLREFNPLAN